MRIRNWVLLVSVFVVTGCSAGTTPKTMTTSSPSTGQAVAAPTGGSFLNEKIPTEVLSIPLQDSDGKSFTLASLSGQYVVISNFLTSCQEICPMTSANMRDIAHAVGKSSIASKIKILEISVDAATDTPSRLTAYQRLFGERSWTLATGTATDLNKLWTYFGAPAQQKKGGEGVDWQTGKPVDHDFVHADLVLIVGADSHWRWLDLGSPKTAKGGIPDKLKNFLNAEGRNNLAKPEEPTWTVSAVLGALSELTGKKF